MNKKEDHLDIATRSMEKQFDNASSFFEDNIGKLGIYLTADEWKSIAWLVGINVPKVGK